MQLDQRNAFWRKIRRQTITLKIAVFKFKMAYYNGTDS